MRARLAEDPIVGAALRAYLRVIAASVVTDRLRAEDRSTVPLDDPENAPVAPDDRPRREIERNAGKQFDPEVVKVFLSITEPIWLELRNEIENQNNQRRYGTKKALRG